jgi:hypothetical protein
MSEPAFAPGEATYAATLARLGLLRIGQGCTISPLAVFVPADAQGVNRPVEIGSGCQVGPFSVLHGGTAWLTKAPHRVEGRAGSGGQRVRAPPERSVPLGDREPVPGVGRACHELPVVVPNRSGADHPTFLRAGSRGRP